MGSTIAKKHLLAEKVLARFAGRGGARGKTLALWGLSFKPNTDDIREAPALTLIRVLTGERDAGPGLRSGGRPQGRAGNHGPAVARGRRGPGTRPWRGADALAVVTEWNQFRNPDFERIKNLLARPLIFDGRNLYSSELLTGLGFTHGFHRPRRPSEPGQVEAPACGTDEIPEPPR